MNIPLGSSSISFKNPNFKNKDYQFLNISHITFIHPSHLIFWEVYFVDHFENLTNLRIFFRQMHMYIYRENYVFDFKYFTGLQMSNQWNPVEEL